MPDMQTRFACRVIRVRFARHRAAHLTGKAVSVEDIRTDFFAEFTRKSGLRLCVLKHILTGFQIRTVIMREYLVALFVAKLTNATRSFANSGYRAKRF
jgi:hypothetical protein